MVSFSPTYYRVELDSTAYKQPRSVLWLQPDGRQRFIADRAAFVAATKRMKLDGLSTKEAAEVMQAEVAKRTKLPTVVTQYAFMRM